MMTPTRNEMTRSPGAQAMGLAFLLFVSTASAGPRDSPNYHVATETTDGGGKRATSAAYTNDGSVGGITGISTVTTPVETAKHGYVGQLYDVTGLTLTAATTNVNEGATLQLGAWQALDDSTFLAVPAASVAWSTVSGPLSLSSGGLATGGAVYQNTGATAQGIALGFTGTLGLTVVNTLPDNFDAYAGDTLDDAWQVQYFGQPPNANAGPLVDFDGDGQNNLFEFTGGLVPTDSLSRFSITIAPVPAQPTQKRIIFSPLVLTGGRTYTVKFRPDLATGTWETLTGTTQSDTGAERTVTDLNATGAKKFYRVEITKP